MDEIDEVPLLLDMGGDEPVASGPSYEMVAGNYLRSHNWFITRLSDERILRAMGERSQIDFHFPTTDDFVGREVPTTLSGLSFHEIEALYLTEEADPRTVVTMLEARRHLWVCLEDLQGTDGNADTTWNIIARQMRRIENTGARNIRAAYLGALINAAVGSLRTEGVDQTAIRGVLGHPEFANRRRVEPAMSRWVMRRTEWDIDILDTVTRKSLARFSLVIDADGPYLRPSQSPPRAKTRAPGQGWITFAEAGERLDDGSTAADASLLSAIANAQAAPSQTFALVAQIRGEGPENRIVLTTAQVSRAMSPEVLAERLGSFGRSVLAKRGYATDDLQDAKFSLIDLPDVLAEVDAMIEATIDRAEYPLILDALTWEALKVQADLHAVPMDEGERLMYRGTEIWRGAD